MTSPLSTRTPPWTVLITGVLLLGFSWPTLVSLHARYLEDGDYSHGHLVLLLTVVLVVLEARRHRSHVLRPSWAGFACAFLLVLVSLFGLASTALLIAQAAMPALMIGALWAVAGAEVTRRYILPLSFAWFGIPVWDVFLEPLRQLTIVVVSGGLHALDMPAFIEGNLVYVPTGTFEIQGGCAGLRYALVAVTLTAFSNILNRRTAAQYVLVTGSALLLALFGNWLRVFLTVAAGLSPEGLVPRLIADYHTTFGWILFVVFMIPVFYLDRALQLHSAEESRERSSPQWSRSAGREGVVVANSIMLAVAIALSFRIISGGVADSSMQPEALAAPDVPGWERRAEWVDGRLPVFVGATAQAGAWYVDGAAQVGVFATHFANQSQGHEVVHTHMRVEGSNAIVVATRSVPATAASGHRIPFDEIEVLDGDGGRRLIWVGFRIAGAHTGSRWQAKLLQALGVLQGRRDAQALVLTAFCDGDCGTARESIARFVVRADAVYDFIAGETEPR